MRRCNFNLCLVAVQAKDAKNRAHESHQKDRAASEPVRLLQPHV